MTKDDAAPTLNQVVRENLRRICEEQAMTQDDVARLVRNAGLPWGRSTVTAFLAGEKALDLEEFALLTIALAPGAELLKGKRGQKVLLGQGSVDLGTVRRYLGAPVVPGPASPSPSALTPKDAAGMLEGFARLEAEQAARGEAELKAARKLRFTAQALSEAAISLWGRSLTAERDARVETSAPPSISTASRQALRGRVTRQLLVELSPILDTAPTKTREKEAK